MGKAPVKKVLAVRKFTDRGEPREAFNRIFEDAQRHTDEFNVISFYGIGGFGKTRLINELAKQLDKYNSDNKDLNKIAHVTYDFSRGTEKMFVLGKLKYLLKKQGLSFPYSDALEAAYNIKCGNPVYKTVGESELIDNPMISVVAKFIPGASSILSTLKTGKTIMEETAKYYKKIEKMWNVDQQNLDKEIKEIGRLEINELDDKASYYFAQDLIHNTESVSDEFRLPVVIFLDTYEELVNSYEAAGFANAYDLWLREDIIKSVPGVLWVIGGREKLRWDENDDFWEGAIEEHELGDLTKEDSFDFLRTAGIPENFLEDIYSVTGGTPLFLDLNVTTYYELEAAGKEITKESFGTSKLQVIERFLRYMSTEDQYIAKLLAVLENWSDEEAETIGEAVLPVFYKENYNAFIEHTIIIKDNEQRYYMHRQVRKVIMDAARSANPEMVRDIYTEKIRYLFAQDWKNMDITSRFNIADKIIDVFEDAHFDKKTYDEMGNLTYPLLTSFYKDGLYTRAYEIFHRLCPTAELDYTACYSYNYNLALACKRCASYRNASDLADEGIHAVKKAYLATSLWNNQQRAGKYRLQCKSMENQLLTAAGKYGEALEVAEENYSKACEQYGETTTEAIWLLNDIGIIQGKMGNHEEALKTYTKVYDTSLKALGADDQHTLIALNNIGNEYYNMRDYDKAVEVFSQAHAAQLKKYGPKNRTVLKSLRGLATAELYRNNYAKAIEYYEKLLQDSKGIYEGNDYGFLSNLAKAHNFSGNNDKAIEMLQDQYEIYKSYYGESHYLTVAVSKDLILYRDGKSFANSLLTLKKRMRGDNQLFNVAQHYESFNNLDGAIEYYLQHLNMLEAAESLSGTHWDEMMMTLSRLGACYFWKEQFKEALKYHQRYYDRCLEKEGLTGHNTILGLTNICQCLEFMGRYRRLEECLQQLLLRYSNDKKIFYRTKVSLAFAYLMQNKDDKCLQELRDVYENRDILIDGMDKPNNYEQMAMQYENPQLIFFQEKFILRSFVRFTEDKDTVLHAFFSEALEKREKVIRQLTE